MREFLKITDTRIISQTIYDFLDVFPHLCEKIESVEAYVEKLSKYANFYVGVEDGKAFGIAVFYSNDTIQKKAYISLIGLKADARGKGLGRWLLGQCENKSVKDGMEQMLLEVDCDNESALLFYQKNGYSITESTDRDSMYMHKRIF